MRLASRLLVAAAAVLCAGIAHAGLRSPQVAVSGTALQNFFNAQGQVIHVATDQLDAQTFSEPLNNSFSAPVLLGSGSVGVYNAAAVSPALYLVTPSSVTPGWSTAASYRTRPQRLVVNLFDNLSTFQGSTTYTGGPPDNSSFGFYGQDTQPVLSQDSRNAAGPRMLAFAGTGARAGSTWLAFETSGVPGGDFADIVALVNIASAAPVPASSSTWSRVKRLYR